MVLDVCGLHDVYCERVRRYVRACFVGRADIVWVESEDVIQNVWLTVLRKPSSVFGRESMVGALMRVARFCFLQAASKRGVMVTADEDQWVVIEPCSVGDVLCGLAEREAFCLAGVDSELLDWSGVGAVVEQEKGRMYRRSRTAVQVSRDREKNRVWMAANKKRLLAAKSSEERRAIREREAARMRAGRARETSVHRESRLAARRKNRPSRAA